MSLEKLVVGSVELTDDAPVHPDLEMFFEIAMDAKQIRRGVYTCTGVHPETSEPVTVEIDHSKPEYRPLGMVRVKYGTGYLGEDLAERVEKVKVYRAGVKTFAEKHKVQTLQQQPAKTEEARAAELEAERKKRLDDQIARSKAERMQQPQVPAVQEKPKTPAPAKKEWVAGSVDGLPEQFVMKMGPKGQEKPYILKAGLLFLAKKNGVKEIKVKPVHWSFQQGKDDPLAGVAVAEATVVLGDGTVYSDFGVASKDNTNKMIHANLDHMASTRASNRALRLATACGMCSVEELPDAPPEVLEAEARVVD
jgi:hypothetical protein